MNSYHAYTMAMQRNPETIEFWRGDLPHWQVEDGRYFVTIHVYGAIPAVGQDRIRRISTELQDSRNKNERVRISRRIFREMELWLDQGCSVHQLAHPEVAAMMSESINFRIQQQIWKMFEFVIMPSHLHMFFELSDGQRLKTVLESFKRWTGHRATKLIDFSGPRFWQTEWFDHWSRSDDQDERIVKYIRENPEKARLVRNFRDWRFGSWSHWSGDQSEVQSSFPGQGDARLA